MYKKLFIILAILAVCPLAAIHSTTLPPLGEGWGGGSHPWQGKRVAYFGDSITDPRNKAAKKKYWTFLQEWLGITPYVYARSGRMWDDIPRQAEECMKEHGDSVDAILIFMGTNDYNNGVKIGEWYTEKEEEVMYGHGQPKTMTKRKRQYMCMDKDTYRGRINIALDKVKRMYPDKQIVLLTPIHRQNFHANDKNWQCSEDYTNQCGLYLKEYVDAVKEASNIWAVPVIDMNALCGLYPMADEYAKFFKDAETDRLHPNDLGHERMAKTLMQQLLTLPVFDAPKKASVFGKIYHNRMDDLTWENEWCAYRMYGPAVQKSGQKLFGYDIWVKNTHDTIVDLRYRLHMPPKGVKMKSFHEDWGNGMDCYAVGASLGCCTPALLDTDGKIIFPWSWEKCEFLEQTPERLKIHVTLKPVGYRLQNGDSIHYTEHRIISVEKGKRFNTCEVWYEGLDRKMQIAVGIVVHKENPKVYADKKYHYIAYEDYQDPTMVKKDGSDGIIYIGARCPEATKFKHEQDHLLAIATLNPGQHYTYQFAATWSKFDVHSFEEWKAILEKAE